MRGMMWAAAMGAVLAVAGCGGTAGAEPPVANEQGDVVSVLENGHTDYGTVRRECDGTTAIYTMKDSSGYDFQIVPGDPRCAAAK